jgi:hypothetical protein
MRKSGLHVMSIANRFSDDEHRAAIVAPWSEAQAHQLLRRGPHRAKFDRAMRRSLSGR